VRRRGDSGPPETPRRLQQSLPVEIGASSPRSAARAARDSEGRGSRASRFSRRAYPPCGPEHSAAEALDRKRPSGGGP